MMDQQPESQEQPMQSDETAPQPEQPRSAEPAQLESLEAELEALRRERDDLEQKLLRVTADYQNYVRRSGQHAQDAADQKLVDVARALLTVLDHFDHALDVDPETATAKTIFDGLRMVRDELLKTLEKFGIKRFEATVGEEFDPTRHEAMMRQSVEGIESNHVTAQFQPGYGIGDRTLRPAKVAVAE